MSGDGVTHGDRLFPETLETDRLRLERLGPENPDPLTFYEHTRKEAPDVEETTRYVGWEPNSTPMGGLEFQEQAADWFAEGRTATYAVRPREGEQGAGEFAGTTGLSVDWDRRRGGLGIWLRKPFWGRGYSGERADALLELAFGRLDLDTVSVAHLLENENSERAITKYVDRHDGRCEGTFRNFVTDNDGTVHDVRNYSITQEEWAVADGSRTDVQLQD